MKLKQIYLILTLALASVVQVHLAHGQTVSIIDNPDWTADSDWTMNAPVASGNTVQDVVLEHNSTIDFTLGVEDSVVISTGITLTTSEDIKVFPGAELHIWGAIVMTDESIKILPSAKVHIHDGGLLIGLADVEFKELSGELIIDEGGTMHWAGDWKNNGGSATTMMIDGSITIGGDLDNKIDIIGDGSITVSGTLNNFPNASIFGCTLTGDGCCLGQVPCVLEAADDPLSVKLLFYNVYLSAGTVFIEWTTASEFDNYCFMIDRSTDAKNWQPIAEVIGSGNSIEQANYQVDDKNPLAGLAYYRLLQKNFEGGISSLGIKAVRYDTPKSDFMIYPNPARESVIISLGNMGNAEVSILDYTGRRIDGAAIKYDQFEFDVSTLPAGLYFVELRNGDVIRTRKLIVI